MTPAKLREAWPMLVLASRFGDVNTIE